MEEFLERDFENGYFKISKSMLVDNYLMWEKLPTYNSKGKMEGCVYV